MAEANEDEIKRALSAIKTPSGGDLISGGHVPGIAVMDGEVYFAIEIDPAGAKEFEPVRAAAEKAVKAIAGVKGVHATLTAHKRPGAGQPQMRPPQPMPQRGRGAGHDHQHGHQHTHAAPADNKLTGIEHVKKMVAVASGKGGVGKSTVAINLAVALSAKGLKVGLLDADIYGPSVPKLSGVKGKPKTSADSKKMLIPLEAHGLKLMSMGFLVAEETPMIWRGPMVQSALIQMMRDVEWGELDVLVIDMPPGTGDAALTLAQQTPVSGAVVVSTPQDIALIDARKAAAMFEKVHVPILGIVENMSYFVCPHCGERSDIFGHGGARDEALRRGVPFLGEVPLHAEIRAKSDDGEPVAGRGVNDPHAKAFAAIADGVVRGLEAADRPKPKLSIG